MNADILSMSLLMEDVLLNERELNNKSEFHNTDVVNANLVPFEAHDSKLKLKSAMSQSAGESRLVEE